MAKQQQPTQYRALVYWGEDRHEEFATGSPQEIADKARAKFGNVTRDGEPLARTIGNACLSVDRGDTRYAEVQLPGGHEPVLSFHAIHERYLATPWDYRREGPEPTNWCVPDLLLVQPEEAK